MLSSTHKPRFLADQMLGKLAKWLRMLGFDTKYLNEVEDSALLRIAKDEKRILLTRDTQLLKTRPIVRKQIRAALVQSDYLDQQLHQVIEEFDLCEAGFTESYCPRCNAPIEPVSKHSVKGKVPSYIHRTKNDFSLCPKCGNLFWKGTHWERIREKAHGILGSKHNFQMPYK